MKKISFLMILIITLTASLYAQDLQGTVSEYNNSNKLVPLFGATLQWEGTAIGVSTDTKGQFSIPVVENNNRLVVRYIGYQTDTLDIKKGDNNIKIILSNAIELKGITISALENSYISSRPILTQVITGEGLRKAACCNLSESFESSASVDVSYSDAITGAKQIQMLGLAGVYSQLMLENTPYIRGLSTPFGLLYVPGSWMETQSVGILVSCGRDGCHWIPPAVSPKWTTTSWSSPSGSSTCCSS